MTLEIKQSSKYKGSEWWDWSVWVDGSAAELEKVKSVTYRLHETFPDPVQVRRNRKEKFRLNSSGWGEFEILVNIDTGTGKPITKKHYLTLEVPKSAAVSAAPASIYLCYAASDKRIAAALEQLLRSHQFKVVNAAQIIGSSFRIALAESLKEIDVVVAIVSDDPSEWVLFEIGLAQGASVPVVLVMEGSAPPPAPLAKLPVVRIPSSGADLMKIPPAGLQEAIEHAVKKRKR